MWISAEERLPEKDGRYLTILKSGARSNHAKRWAGMGEPEVTFYCESWPSKWNGRGQLVVAYWMELPKFNMVWVKNIEGEEGHWEPPNAH